MSLSVNASSSRLDSYVEKLKSGQSVRCMWRNQDNGKIATISAVEWLLSAQANRLSSKIVVTVELGNVSGYQKAVDALKSDLTEKNPEKLTITAVSEPIDGTNFMKSVEKLKKFGKSVEEFKQKDHDHGKLPLDEMATVISQCIIHYLKSSED